MIDILKNGYRLSIMYSIFFLMIGILLLINPAGFVIIVSYIISLLLITIGGNSVIKYYNSKSGFASAILTFGIIMLLAGIFLIIRPTFIGSIIPTIIGISLIVSSSEKIIYARYQKDRETKSHAISIASAAITLVAGFFLVFNPLEGTLIVTQIIGFVIIIYSIIDIIGKIKLKKGFKNVVQKDISGIKIIDEK